MGYQLIEHIEVGAGGVASIEFTGIPQDGVDLVLLTSTRMNGANRYRITFNSNSTNVYSDIRLYGNGTDGYSEGLSGQTAAFGSYSNNSGTTANTFTSTSLVFANYTSSNPKSFSGEGAYENNDTFGLIALSTGTTSVLAAIASMKLIPDASATFEQYSTASLYKITAD
jgi:hypothetical protein